MATSMEEHARWGGLRVPTGAVVSGTPIELDVGVATPRRVGAVAGGTSGAEAEPAWVLLLSGLGGQRIDWPEPLVEGLLTAGFGVIAPDNRDAGRSTVLPGPEVSLDALRAAVDAVAGEVVDGGPVVAPYPLAALADDAVAVLDHLGVGRAHVLGRSMGGMVAQHLAVRAPGRLRSLTLLATTTGARDVGQPTSAAAEALAAPTPTGRDAVIAAGVARARVTASPDRFDEQEVRRRLTARYDRAHDPAGTARQLLAILADGDRTPLLERITAPTLVLHGDADPLVTVSGGRALGRAIPGARLVEIPGLGHDLPAGLLERVTALVVEHLRAVGGAEGPPPSRAAGAPPPRGAGPDDQPGWSPAAGVP